MNGIPNKVDTLTLNQLFKKTTLYFHFMIPFFEVASSIPINISGAFLLTQKRKKWIG